MYFTDRAYLLEADAEERKANYPLRGLFRISVKEKEAGCKKRPHTESSPPNE